MTVVRYLIARGKEASTWAAIAALLTALHVSLDQGLWQHIVDIGVGCASIAGILIKGGEAT